MQVIGSNFFQLFVSSAAIALGISSPAFAGNSLYTTYTFNGPTQVDLATCGSTNTSQGCFGGASLVGLSGVCSLLTGPTTTNGNVATQRLYLLQTGSDVSPVVTLKVYNKTVSAQPVMVGPNPSTKVTTAVSLFRSVNIASLKGGSKATCSMVANASSIFISTSATQHVVQLDKKKFIGHPIGGGPLREMTADENGYVTLNFEGRNPTQHIFGSDGKQVEFGGLANPLVVPNQTNGVPLE
jgi:hypothetical protein